MRPASEEIPPPPSIAGVVKSPRDMRRRHGPPREGSPRPGPHALPRRGHTCADSSHGCWPACARQQTFRQARVTAQCTHGVEPFLGEGHAAVFGPPPVCTTFASRCRWSAIYKYLRQRRLCDFVT